MAMTPSEMIEFCGNSLAGTQRGLEIAKYIQIREI